MLEGVAFPQKGHRSAIGAVGYSECWPATFHVKVAAINRCIPSPFFCRKCTAFVMIHITHNRIDARRQQHALQRSAASTRKPISMTYGRRFGTFDTSIHKVKGSSTLSSSETSVPGTSYEDSGHKGVLQYSRSTGEAWSQGANHLLARGPRYSCHYVAPC